MARDKDSYVFRKGVTPNTLSVISSKNRIFATAANGENTQIGVVSSFDPSESRSVEPIRGIGFGDQIAELVPNVTDPMTISVVRTALYLSNIYQVLGYKAGMDGIARSLKHHRWPFDIRQELVFSSIAARYAGSGPAEFLRPVDNKEGADEYTDDASKYAILTLYEACWLSDYSVSYAADTAMVQETVTITVSDIMAFDGAYLKATTTLEPYSALGSGTGYSNRFKGYNK